MDYKDNIEVAVLNSISKTVIHERNISNLLKTVLDILHREMGLLRGTFTLMHGDTLFIEASNGLTEEEMRRGTYKVGNNAYVYLDIERSAGGDIDVDWRANIGARYAF